jgi:hypothetical protein
MDFLEAPLNPCSIESIPEPLTLSNGSRIWPLMLACYELQDDKNRHGQLDLFAIRVPDMRRRVNDSMVLRFGCPTKVLSSNESKKSGILDGKWIRAANNDSTSDEAPSFYFASAHSSGKIAVHCCSISNENTSKYPQEEESVSPLNIHDVGQSESLSSDGQPPLCLSLNWDSASFGES